MTVEITDKDRLKGIEHRILEGMKALQTAHYLICQMTDMQREEDADWPDIMDDAIAEAELKEPMDNPDECFE